MTYMPGTDALLYVEWRESTNGPLVDVTNLTIRIVNLVTSVVAVATTSVGVVHVSTGVYSYTWAIPEAQEIGTYLVIWEATDAEDDAVAATETIIVSPVTTTAGTSGPCTAWDPIWCCDLDTPLVSGYALEAATEVLYALSGRQFGACTVELWPCRRQCFDGSWPSGWTPWMGATGSFYYPQPALIRGLWYNITCATCMEGCSCTPLSQVELPIPLISVDEVKLDGAVLLPGTDYRLDNGKLLTRLGGDDWPWCNDLSQDEGDGTWSVTVTMGKAVPTLGKMAVGELACEFAKACMNNDDCRLPKPIQQLSRQGVSMTFIDPNEYFKNGVVGLYFSDLFISATNPSKLRRAAKVYNLDDPPAYRVGA